MYSLLYGEQGYIISESKPFIGEWKIDSKVRFMNIRHACKNSQNGVAYFCSTFLFHTGKIMNNLEKIYKVLDKLGWVEPITYFLGLKLFELILVCLLESLNFIFKLQRTYFQIAMDMSFPKQCFHCLY